MNQVPTNAQCLPFLLEIGSEEIPARFIPNSLGELESRAVQALQEAQLEAGGVRVLATPRRLVLLIENLAVRQPDRTVEIKGPPVSVAFASDGKPTPAGLGFARKSGVELGDCQRGTDKRGEFLVARKLQKGRAAPEVLAEILPDLIRQIPYRKVMRWGDHELQYPRPIQWLVALLGPEIIDFSLDYLRTGRSSRGHRTLAGNAVVTLADPGSYLDEMEKAFVVVDQNRRRALIIQGIEQELAAYDPSACLVQDPELLEEVVNLCEYPTPFMGSYEEEFFALPAEVITTALKSHQRYFTVSDGQASALKPRFVSVRDGGRDHLDNVIAGNERVLRARLADALFYWEFDQKKTVAERVEMLATVTWLEGFGSVKDKTGRLGGLTTWLWQRGLGGELEVPEDLLRAAAICKSDLVSEMIKDGKEFTKLEGFIGSRYAELAGESPEVCRAMQRHYLPRSATGELPGDSISSCLSIADRLDNLAGCWLAGFIPTGAKDPYALRRHVLAILRILLDLRRRVNLEEALAEALGLVGGFAPQADLGAVGGEISAFIKTRMTVHFTENLGSDPEVTRAVVPVRWRDPVDALAWIEALTGFRDREDFQQLATGFKRCRNILKGDLLPVSGLDSCLRRWIGGGQGLAGEDFGDLSEPAEVALCDLVAGQAELVQAAESAGQYGEIFAIFSGFGPTIDRYFEEVRVNVDDPGVRRVRLSFLREIHGLFARYADFSEISPAESG